MSQLFKFLEAFESAGCDVSKLKDLTRPFRVVSNWPNPGGNLSWKDEDEEHSLSVIDWDRKGFIVKHGTRDPRTRKPISGHYAVDNPDLISEFEIVDEIYMPKGCIVSTRESWNVIEDFVEFPSVLSDRIQWIDGNDIPWPPEMPGSS